jgi:hypothetical protein
MYRRRQGRIQRNRDRRVEDVDEKGCSKGCKYEDSVDFKETDVGDKEKSCNIPCLSLAPRFLPNSSLRQLPFEIKIVQYPKIKICTTLNILQLTHSRQTQHQISATCTNVYQIENNKVS